MSELHLEPFAVTIDWRLDNPTSADKWQTLFISYLETLGKRSTQKPNTIIGHIKGITNFSESEFIQVSVISPKRPATITAQLPDNFSTRKLSFTLNFLVYGLSYKDARHIAQSTAVEFAEQMKGTATFTMLSDPNQANHHHH